MTEEFFVREVEACERMLYRVSRSILHSDADCCDAVQEALSRAWQHRDSVQEAYFRTWLTRILINECYSIGRRRARETPVYELPEQEATPDRDTDIDLREAIRSLKEPARLVLTLHYLEGFSLREIAQMQRVPLGTVKYRIVHARRALKKALCGERKGGVNL